MCNLERSITVAEIKIPSPRPASPSPPPPPATTVLHRLAKVISSEFGDFLSPTEHRNYIQIAKTGEREDLLETSVVWARCEEN